MTRKAGLERKTRQAIPVSCEVHRGPRTVAHLVVTRTEDEITLLPHATGLCQITFDKPGAGLLLQVLAQWVPLLREPGVTIDMSPAL